MSVSVRVRVCRYGFVLRHVAPDQKTKSQLISESCAYWHRSPMMCALLCRKLIEQGIVDPAAALAYAFTEENRRFLCNAAGWELVNEVIDRR